jgi:hypothetical protein
MTNSSRSQSEPPSEDYKRQTEYLAMIQLSTGGVSSTHTINLSTFRPPQAQWQDQAAPRPMFCGIAEGDRDLPRSTSDWPCEVHHGRWSIQQQDILARSALFGYIHFGFKTSVKIHYRLQIFLMTRSHSNLLRLTPTALVRRWPRVLPSGFLRNKAQEEFTC